MKYKIPLFFKIKSPSPALITNYTNERENT